MRTRTDPASVLFGKTRRQVLSWLYGHPDQRYYLRQLVRQTGTAPGALQRELRLLTGAGLVRRTQEGRQVYFQANRENPIFNDLQGLLVKTVGATDAIRQALAAMDGRIRVAFIYGSVAKGNVRASSDIDVLVIGNTTFSEVVSALAESQRLLGRDINPSVYPVEEFGRKVRAGHHFLTTILEEPKVFILGNEHELGRLAQERVAAAAPKQHARNIGTARSRRA